MAGAIIGSLLLYVLLAMVFCTDGLLIDGIYVLAVVYSIYANRLFDYRSV